MCGIVLSDALTERNADHGHRCCHPPDCLWTLAIHFGNIFLDQDEERQLITEALREIDPAGVDASEMRWYISGDEPQEGFHVYVVMRDDGSEVITAFSARTLAKRIRAQGEE